MKKQMKLRASTAPIVATGFRHTKGGELAVGRNGELNASSKKDLMVQQQKFLQASAQNLIQSEADFLQNEAVAKVLLEAARHDPQAHRVLGERITEALFITANRQGFARKYMAKVNVAQGSIVRFKMYKKDVTAVYSTSPTRVETQVMKDNYYTPPELILVARPYVTQNDLNQSPGDVLGEKYTEATEAIMVAEDRLWKRNADTAANMYTGNPLTVINGQLTPYTLARLRTKVTQWGLKAPHLLIASDIYEDVIGNSEFYSAMDPVARHELLLTGEIATMYGMTVTSDAYRHEEHRVLNAGELYVISEAVNHGAYADRDSLTSAPIGIETENIPGRGWVISESWTSMIANARSVARAIRV